MPLAPKLSGSNRTGCLVQHDHLERPCPALTRPLPRPLPRALQRSRAQAHFLDAITMKFGAEYLQGDGTNDFKAAVDVCEDGLVSWWEFDVFTQLYQPWGR